MHSHSHAKAFTSLASYGVQVPKDPSVAVACPRKLQIVPAYGWSEVIKMKKVICLVSLLFVVGIGANFARNTDNPLVSGNAWGSGPWGPTCACPNPFPNCYCGVL